MLTISESSLPNLQPYEQDLINILRVNLIENNYLPPLKFKGNVILSYRG